jgi:hypothetical protein
MAEEEIDVGTLGGREEVTDGVMHIAVLHIAIMAAPATIPPTIYIQTLL